MRSRSGKTRRLGGTHITIIVVALAVVLAPTAVYATSRVSSIIADPYNSSVYARLSEEGRLGVRGETTSQQGVPSNEWHKRLDLPPESPSSTAASARLLHGAPPGSGIGISQLIVSYDAAAPDEFPPKLWLVAKPVNAPVCPAESSVGYRPGVDELLFEFATPQDPNRAGRSEQLLFPVPLTVNPSPTHSMCVYATAFIGFLELSANGVSGPATPTFAAAKGLPAADTGGK